MRTLLLLFTILGLAGCGSPVYTFDPIEAQAVDWDTGTPIEGVNVLANWQLEKGGMDGPRPVGQLEVKEARTDKAGRFRFEGFAKANPSLAELRQEDPRLIFFKPGYELVVWSSTYPRAGTRTPGPHRTSSINGRTIRMKRATPVELGGQLTYYVSLHILLEEVTKGCGWKKFPMLLSAMQAESRRIQADSPKAGTDLLTVDYLDIQDGPGCGMASTYLRDLIK